MSIVVFTAYLAVAIVLLGPVIFAIICVAIGCAADSMRRRKRPPNRLERQLALARLEDTLARQERAESTEVAS